MLAQITIGDVVHDFTDGALTAASDLSVCKLSISQKIPATTCMKGKDPSKQVNEQDPAGQSDASSFAFSKSICIDDFSRQKHEDGENIMEVHKFLGSCVPQDNNIDTSDLSGVNKPFILLDDGWKVAHEVDDSEINMATACPKLAQDYRMKKPSRSRMKRENKKVAFSLSSLQFTRRKRSKRVRSTTWAMLGSIAAAPKQKGGITPTPEKLKRSRRANGIQDRKHENSITVRSAEKLKVASCISSGPISLKVKFGKESIMDIITKIDGSKDMHGIPKKTYEETSKDTLVLSEKRESENIKSKLCDENLGSASDTCILEKDSIGNLCSSTLCDPFQVNVGNYGAAADNRVSDSGTSPDSEIINIAPDAQVSGKDAEDLHDIMLSPIGCCASPNFSILSETLSEPWNYDKEGKKKHVPLQSGASTLTAIGIASVSACSSGNRVSQSVPSSRAGDLTVCHGTSELEKEETYVSLRVDTYIDSSYSPTLEKSLPCSKDEKALENPKSCKVSKSRIEMMGSCGREENVSKKKGNENKPSRKCIDKEEGDCDQIFHDVEKYAETGLRAFCENGKDGEIGNENKIGRDTSRTTTVPGVVGEASMPPRNAWVSCDDCHKWRRIPALLADEIEENKCRWVCKDNMDRRYADCLIPQEKSNAEINAELEISDASGEEDACDGGLHSHKANRNKSLVTANSPWTPIKSNMFLNRRRKNQTIDEIMVCSCKQPADGRMGCGHKCLNRMLNIECIPGTCPCSESCSNQQFQKRKYAKLKSIRCGKKGFGLHLLQDVSAGQFLIEYVGEVLDMHAYEARQKEYAAKGHRHFYFMTLNGSEVIDACAKGNLGRFINHSCEPNCRTEKWMVNGEVCIGIFSTRDIKKGEEATFDYNYVRVFGAAAKKCVCGSSQCRGYIGGDPLNSEIVVQGDSDDEYSEVLMARDVGVTDLIPSTVVPTSALNEKRVRAGREVSEKTDNMDGSLSTGGLEEISSEESKEMPFHDKVEVESSSTAAGISTITKKSKKSKAKSVSPKTSSEKKSLQGRGSHIQQEENSLQTDNVDMHAALEECSATEKSKDRSSLKTISGKSLSEPMENSVKSNSHDSEEGGIAISKLHPSTNISGRLSSHKKKKPKNDIATEKRTVEMNNKSGSVPAKPKMPLADLSNGRFEAVQEKLNALLDPDGGISKKKDASRGYLKLLLLTVASEDNGNGQGIQSNRDLSMILDALLKTKSRTVLVDVINKNGLQMLHNIMKRCRKEYNKIPILRKLLKVLEYLATREILTSEHINGGPRCPGIESFRDSILGLTEHVDKQVHQITRNFRDRWIPRYSRKYHGSMERDDGWTESHLGPNSDRFSAPRYPCSDLAVKPPDTINSSAKVVSMSSREAEIPEGSTELRSKRRRKSRWDQPFKESREVVETTMAGDYAPISEDVPPGFSSPLKYPVLPSDTNSTAVDPQRRPSHAIFQSEVATGYSQVRFNSRLPVAYGIPVSVVQQFGVQQAETSGSWNVAPGMPFQPFPPLPPYPRDRSRGPTSQAATISGQDCNNDASFGSSHNPPSTSAGVAVPGIEAPGGGNQLDFQRFRGYNNLSRNYFRQLKPKNPKLPPPWARRSNWGPVVNGPRNGMCHPEFGSGSNEMSRPYNSPHVSNALQNGNSFNQHPQPMNWS